MYVRRPVQLPVAESKLISLITNSLQGTRKHIPPWDPWKSIDSKVPAGIYASSQEGKFNFQDFCYSNDRRLIPNTLDGQEGTLDTQEGI